MELNTYGDLKKVIKAISLKQKGEKIGNIALGTLMGFIPGAEAAKTTFDFIKAAISKPDNKKTNTWLDKLDIDDNMSKIIDNTVENGFMQTIVKTIEKEPDTKPLESDFNMNQKLVDFLKNNYQGRTVTGIKENIMEKELLKKLIKEEIAKIQQETTLPANQPKPDPKQKLQGATLNLSLFKQLAPNVSPQSIQTAIGLVKQNKSLTPISNKVLADLMIAMIKTSDDSLLGKVFQNLKNMQAG